MNKQKRLTGWLLIMAAITFWISWFLMPDAGTTDTQYILTAVKEVRINVLCSVIIQIISSVLYLVALFSSAQLNLSHGKLILTGISLFGIGVMGLCADAFFHLLAFFMTDNSVHVQQDVVHVMECMQTTGVVFLIPLLFPFFIGSLVLAIGLRKKVLLSKASIILFVTAFAVAIIGGVCTNAFHHTIPGLSIATLAIFACGQVWIGIGLIKLPSDTAQRIAAKKKNQALEM